MLQRQRARRQQRRNKTRAEFITHNTTLLILLQTNKHKRPLLNLNRNTCIYNLNILLQEADILLPAHLSALVNVRDCRRYISVSLKERVQKRFRGQLHRSVSRLPGFPHLHKHQSLVRLPRHKLQTPSQRHITYSSVIVRRRARL